MSNNNQWFKKLIEKKGVTLLVIMLFIIIKGVVALYLTDPGVTRMFNLIVTSLMFLFVFMVVYHKTKKGEAVKYRPLLYVGTLIYLAFVVSVLYFHFTT